MTVHINKEAAFDVLWKQAKKTHVPSRGESRYNAYYDEFSTRYREEHPDVSTDALDDGLLDGDQDIISRHNNFMAARAFQDDPDLGIGLASMLINSTISPTDYDLPKVKNTATGAGLAGAVALGTPVFLATNAIQNRKAQLLAKILGTGVAAAAGYKGGHDIGQHLGLSKVLQSRGGSMFPEVNTQDMIIEHFDKDAFDAFLDDVLEKQAFLGVSVPVKALDKDEKYNLSVGFPQIIGVDANFGTGTIRPTLGVGLPVPLMLGAGYFPDKRRIKGLSEEDMTMIESNKDLKREFNKLQKLNRIPTNEEIIKFKDSLASKEAFDSFLDEAIEKYASNIVPSEKLIDLEEGVDYTVRDATNRLSPAQLKYLLATAALGGATYGGVKLLQNYQEKQASDTVDFLRNLREM